MDIQKTYWQNSESSMSLSFPIAKVNRERRTVSGFASLDNLDRHGDIVTADANRGAFENFRGNIREMHQPLAVGKMLDFKEDVFFDKETGQKYNGIYVTVYVSKGAQDTWEKCLDGTLTGFSIGGNIVDAKMEKSDDGGESRRVIHKYDLHELSIVDSPANQLANIFSIQKNSEGHSVVKGMIADTITENVFWCGNDEVASTSIGTQKDCVVCGDPMTSIGWVEQNDTEKFEAIEKVIDSYFKKDDAPTSAHEATETAAPGLAGTINSDKTINLYPDQNNKKKVTFEDGLKKSDEILLNEGGNKMAEDTNTEAAEVAADVEAPAEEVSAVEETAEDASIEKAVSISEVEDTLDFTKMVGDLKAFIGESVEKNYALQSATIGDLQKVITATNAELEKMTASHEDLKKSYDALAEENKAIKKTVEDLGGKIEYVDHQLKGFESATAVKKSIGVSAPMEQAKQGIWQGHFLGVNSL